jgi:cobalamin biosynthesis protein CobT
MGQLFKMGEHRECHIPQPLGAHLRRRNPDRSPAVRGDSGRYRDSGHRIPASGRTRGDTFGIGAGDVEDDDHRAGADDDRQAVAYDDHQAFAETVADEDPQVFAEADSDEDAQVHAEAEADSDEDAQVHAEAEADSDEDPQVHAEAEAEADSDEDPQVHAEADEDGAPDHDRQADQDLLALTAGARDTPAPLRRGRVRRRLRPPLLAQPSGVRYV